MKISLIQQLFVKCLRLALNKSGLRQKRNVVFIAPVGFHFEHLMPLIKEIENTPNLNIIVVDISDWQKRPQINNCEFISRDNFYNKRWNFYDAIIATDFSSIPWWFKSGARVGLLHGAGPKVGFIETLSEGLLDVIFSPGPYIKRVQKRIIKNTIGKDTILLPIGLPATDVLFNKALTSEVKLKNNKPIILYAPSWHLEPSYVVMNEVFIKELASQNKYHIIVRPHPNLLQPEKCGGKDWEKLLLSYENENFEMPMEGSIYDYLHKSVAIIGDYSSVIYEYLLFDRPGFIFCSREVMYDVFGYGALHPDSDAIIEPLCAAYDMIPEPEKLLEVLDKGIENSAASQKARNELMHEAFYNVGAAAKAAAKETIRLLEFN